ncbi:MAG: type II toxin-antitoxin system VapC family toxin [Chloroflexota bacterium]|nr:type II toxin-antitoxin system VapC family toxin [Chloroflexota bacterium]
MIVVDTNIIAYLFLEGSGSQSTKAEQLIFKDPDWAAPILWRSEFRNILAHYIRKELLSLVQCQEIMREAMTLMSGREYEVASFEVLRLVATSTCSAYDCEFVALAEDLGTPLVTADQKILSEFGNLTKALNDYP